jgi:hypothetical protein
MKTLLTRVFEMGFAFVFTEMMKIPHIFVVKRAHFDDRRFNSYSAFMIRHCPAKYEFK